MVCTWESQLGGKISLYSAILSLMTQKKNQKKTKNHNTLQPQCKAWRPTADDCDPAAPRTKKSFTAPAAGLDDGPQGPACFPSSGGGLRLWLDIYRERGLDNEHRLPPLALIVSSARQSPYLSRA